MSESAPQPQRYEVRRIRRRRRKLPPPKTTIAAVLLLCTGIILFTFGAVITWGKFAQKKERERGLAMLVIGAITLLPGSYATVMLYGAFVGWPGYDYSAIPSYDD
mmetsp:Transcript_10080/g.15554  ORF Transcript_10080/g.15554 Transcript_10080/m.15554 type:complete len:105 (+) Transcript_10080:116-430(+)